MDPPGGVIRLALFGSPVSQSLSPRIHRRFAAQAGIDLEYRAIETPRGQLATALERFRAGGGAGCNVTLPLKREALELAAAASDHALRAGAANTLVKLEDAGWRAETTDGLGLLSDLRCSAGLSLTGMRIAVLGAGGAAASVLGPVLEAGPRSVTIFNRSRGPAGQLADRHADLGPVSAAGLDEFRSSTGFALVINATSLGHDGQLPPIAAEVFAPGAVCYDMNYGSASAPLRNWCAREGIRYFDGLGMLVGQAALSFALWTGHAPSEEPVLAALRADFSG